MNRTTRKKLIYSLCTSVFIVGLLTTLSWQYTSRWIGLILLLYSASLMYYTYRKEHTGVTGSQEVSLRRASLGILLILIDISYNTIMKDPFKYFDFGMIIAGLVIILLNLNWLAFLKLDERLVTFSTYFIFITLMLYGFFFTGVKIILGNTVGGSNPFWDWFSQNVVFISTPILNLIKPTYAKGVFIDFNGFQVSIGYACSGIESISVFISAVIAYFISTNKIGFKKIVKYTLIGGTALYIMNIMRVIILILVGYYYGLSTMMFVHTNLGWIMFVFGMSIFWYLAFNDK